MKRDDDLVRAFLLAIEASEGPVSLDRLDVPGAGRDEVVYHLKLLDDAGFIQARFLYGDDTTLNVFVSRLTWDGHEFLDAVRDDGVWDSAKSQVASKVGSASLQILQAVATAIVMSRL